MGQFICANLQCKEAFFSKHSVAKYCSRHCANQANQFQRLRNNGKPGYSDEFLLKHLIELSKQLGRTPSKEEVKRPDEITYRAHFGSYNNAVIAAGLIPNRAVPPSLGGRKSFLDTPLSLRFQVLKRDSFRCQYCGGTPQEGYVLNVDHITPRSKGGPTSLDNMVTACWICNQGKGNT